MEKFNSNDTDSEASSSEEQTEEAEIDIMPCCTLELPIFVQEECLLDSFRSICESHNFVKSSGSVYKQKRGFFFFRCLCREKTTLKFKTRQNEFNKTVTIRGLSGDPLPISSLIHDFCSRLQGLIMESEASEAKNLAKEQSLDFDAVSQYCGNDLQEIKALVQERAQSNYSRLLLEKHIFERVGNALLQKYVQNTIERNRKLERIRTEVDWESKIACTFEFNRSVELVNRLSLCTCPSEKINCLRGVLADIKSEVFTSSHFYHGMETTFVAFVLLKSNLENLVAEVMLLKDWQKNYTINVFCEAINKILKF